MKLSLHIHSKYSHDSKASVGEILEAAEKSGFDVTAITDHNTAAGGLEALKKQKTESSRHTCCRVFHSVWTCAGVLYR